jgi:hypothetical protein
VKGTNLLVPLDQCIVDRFRIDLPNGPKCVRAFPHFKLSTKTFILNVHSCDLWNTQKPDRVLRPTTAGAGGISTQRRRCI